MISLTRNLPSMGPRPGEFPLGSMRSRAAARAIQLTQELEIQERRAEQLRNLTPLERTFTDASDDPDVREKMLMTARFIIPKCQMFGSPLPSPEKIRALAKGFEERKQKYDFDAKIATKRELEQTGGQHTVID
jgi:hypothetical protein